MLKKSDIIWNTMGSLVYSFFNALILVFCTRMNGIEIAGMFSICYATGCILNAIGDMGIRIFQVTDTERKYELADYIYARIIAVSLMLIIGIAFVFISGYKAEKLFIALIIILIRVIDNFSETTQSEFQLNNNFSIAGKALLFRNVAEIIFFAIFDIITQNIYISFSIMLFVSILIFIFYDYRILNKITKIKYKFNKKNIILLLKECLPLGISTLVSMYTINAVKYAIDSYGNNTMQTYFNILYMPTFVINLVSVLAIKIFLKVFGEQWNNKEYKKFIKTILILIGVLIVSTILIEVVCFIIGIPILNFIYGVDLSENKIHLLILIFSGLLYAISTIMFYALGTIRYQKSTTINYFITAVIAIFISNWLVSKYQMLGATIASMGIMFVLCLTMIISFIIGFNKQKVKREESCKDEKI